jgi:hypothetical protein
MRLEVLMPFSAVMLPSLVDKYQCFWGTCCIHLQGIFRIAATSENVDNIQNCVQVKVFMAVTMKNVFWHVMTCDPCKNRRFGGMFCLNHKGDRNHTG